MTYYSLINDACVCVRGLFARAWPAPQRAKSPSRDLSSLVRPRARYADDVMPEVTGAVRLYATHTLCISCLACCCEHLRVIMTCR